MSDPSVSSSRPSGLREQKRQQTLRRIVDAGVTLFGRNGYEATTLEAIAAEAGISRRTFFHYFKSKDDILLSMQTGLGERVVDALSRQPTHLGPLQATRQALRDMVAPYDPEELMVVDRLMRSSEAVKARKYASYVEDEAVIFSALQTRWPEQDEMGLRVIATLTITAVRLTMDRWSRDGGHRAIGTVLDETFAAMDQARG